MAQNDDSESKPAKVIVAIDLGTSRSGFSYAHHPYDFMDAVEGFEHWPSQKQIGAQPYCKTQTSLLYVENDSGPEGLELKAWGWTAFHEHLKLLQSSRKQLDGKTFHFLSNFKLALAKSEEEFKLEAGLTARRVVSDYLRELSNLIEEELRSKYGEHIRKEDIQWCLTVPAIWDDFAKQEMRTCAEIAGLAAGPLNAHGGGSPHPVLIVLEPEAASVYCLDYLRRTSRTDLPPKSKILVVDAGGGTVDLALHETVDSENSAYRVEEISPSSGDLCGSKYVDDAFYDFLDQKIGCYKDFTHEYPCAVLKLRKNWEDLKIHFDGLSGPYEITLPGRLSNYWEAHESVRGNSNPDNDYEEISMTLDEMKSIFDSVIDRILKLIEEQLAQVEPEEELKSITVMVVGGFSASPYLMSQIRERFKSRVKSIINPTHPGQAVTTGAVVYAGLGGEIITSRISRKTYGIACIRDFLKTDPQSSLVRAGDGRPKCKDAFQIYARKGDPIPVDYCHKVKFAASNLSLGKVGEHDSIKLEVYSSNDYDPAFVTDPGTVKECTYVFPVPSRQTMREVPVIEVSMYFGRATIEVTARAVNFSSDEVTLPKLDFGDRVRQVNVDGSAAAMLDRSRSEMEAIKLSNTEKGFEMSETDGSTLALALKRYFDQKFDQLTDQLTGHFTSALRASTEEVKHGVEGVGHLTIALERSSVPRFVCPVSDGKKRLKISKLIKGIKPRDSLKLRFLCEAYHEDYSLHVVEDQEGIEMKTWKPWIKSLTPCFAWSLTIIFLSLKSASAVVDVTPLPISLPNMSTSSYRKVLARVKLSNTAADVLKPLLPEIDKDLSGLHTGVGQSNEEGVSGTSRAALSELLNSLKAGEFDRKVGLYKVALKNPEGSFDNIVWVCKSCLEVYKNGNKVEFL